MCYNLLQVECNNASASTFSPSSVAFKLSNDGIAYKRQTHSSRSEAVLINSINWKAQEIDDIVRRHQ